MAVMWSRTLPSWVIHDPRRAAECEVYKRLDLVLEDSWSVYYSRPWWGLSPTGGEIDGEADFVVAHPDHGVLFIEVKGGLISHDPTSSKWRSLDRFGLRHSIKDPVQQAMKSKHHLLKKFQQAPSWPSQRVRLRHGVIFPDSQPEDNSLVGGYEQALFCFSKDLRDGLRTWVAKRLASHTTEGGDREIGPGHNGIAVIDALIAAPTRLKVPLHRMLAGDIAQQDILMTGAQLHAISWIETAERAVVEGGAGTGKTVIGCELAVRYVNEGHRVLICCVSEALAASLNDRIGPHPNLDVLSIDALHIRTSRGEAALYDALIVDEGQDVEWSDWALIDECLVSGGLLRVLFDSNQAVYRRRDDLETLLHAKGIPLLLNLRNTKRIASVTELLYRGPLIQCAGPDGTGPVLLETPSYGLIERATEVVLKLIQNQGLAAADVAVLAADSELVADLRLQFAAAKLRTTDAVTRAPGCVVIETIARFKGLESLAVVIVADRISANNPELSYVAVSRARALLLVVGPVEGTLLGKAMRDGGSE